MNMDAALAVEVCKDDELNIQIHKKAKLLITGNPEKPTTQQT